MIPEWMIDMNRSAILERLLAHERTERHKWETLADRLAERLRLDCPAALALKEYEQAKGWQFKWDAGSPPEADAANGVCSANTTDSEDG